MRSLPRAASRAVAIVTVLCLALTACGSDSDSAALDFSDVDITVGSKNFTEQYVLSEILIQALAANGANVTDASDTGDTPTTRAALIGGDIDAYWEYNSTGWVNHLGQSTAPVEDGEELTEAVREADAANGIEWIGRSSFNNTYGFAMSPDVAEENQATRYSVDKFDLEAMAEYLEDKDEAIVCVESDFQSRPDGLPLFEDSTEFTIPELQLLVFDDPAGVYEAGAAGRCDFSEVFTTDGEIDALDLELVVDDGVFYIYNASLNINSDLYGQAADDFDTLVGQILRPMSQSRITELNRRVSDGTPVSVVAEEYLRQFDIN
jgi:osmoprotectant transport system substrate-binding protein